MVSIRVQKRHTVLLSLPFATALCYRGILSPCIVRVLPTRAQPRTDRSDDLGNLKSGGGKDQGWWAVEAQAR